MTTGVDFCVWLQINYIIGQTFWSGVMTHETTIERAELKRRIVEYREMLRSASDDPITKARLIVQLARLLSTLRGFDELAR